MKRFVLFLLVVCFVLLGAGFLIESPSVSADVVSINYPAPNDIISQSARVSLNVTSNDSTSNCVFSYDNVSDVPVSCSGVSLVDFPNSDGTYRIRVTDVDSGSFVDQQVTITKPGGGVVFFVYTLTVFVLSSIIFLIVFLISKLATFETNLYHVAGCVVLYLVFLITYQLNLEYVSVSFILSYINMFFSSMSWVLIVFPFINYVICLLVRTFNKKKVPSVHEQNGRF
jgi:hypothetical protein